MTSEAEPSPTKESWPPAAKIAAWSLGITTLLSIAGLLVSAHAFGIGQSSSASAPTGARSTGASQSGTPVAVASTARSVAPEQEPTAATCPNQHLPKPSGGSYYVALNVKSASEPASCWSTSVNPPTAPTDIRFLISYENVTNKPESDVLVGINLPPGFALVPNSTIVYNGNYANGYRFPSNDIAGGRLDIGNYNPGIGAYVTVEASTPWVSEMGCGSNRYTAVGIAYPRGQNQYYNVANIDFYRDC